MKQESLNRRELYKNQKLQQINQIYYCECGKNYLTFSALYLHARNKHEVKLTTKRSPLNCRVEQREEKTIVTYFIHNNSQPSVISFQEKQNSGRKQDRVVSVLETVDAFLRQECGEGKGTIGLEAEIIQQFKKYLAEVQELLQEELTDPHELTLYFNEFVTYYLPLAFSRGAFQLHLLPHAEPALIRLWQWLRRNQLTDLQLLHRSQPSPVPFAQPAPYMQPASYVEAPLI